jgi:2-keto-4-pentenoate hydratase/2-oxohepta-3-ene-1,7-dioic acid hydratase in catechol pathway
MRIGRVEVEGEVVYCEAVEDGVRLLSGSLESGLQQTGDELAAGTYRLLSPVRPDKILVVLGAFPRGQSTEEARQVPPKFAAKLPTAVIADGEEVVVPAEIGTAVTVEPELAVVIGSVARRLSPGDAASAILGYTCFNDVTHLPYIREQGDFLRAKSPDTFGPMGPWIETSVSHKDVTAGLAICASVNGTVVHTGNTADFTHLVSEVVSEATRYYTLRPGDVISLGTAPDPVTAEIGDRVCVEVERVGSLTNRLAGEPGS